MNEVLHVRALAMLMLGELAAGATWCTQPESISEGEQNHLVISTLYSMKNTDI
jgi:hypothetical protein